MKTKSRNLIISFLITLAMLFGVFVMTPLTASALSITPTPEETPAETIYVGGVALSKGQYVKNGETIATTGEPDWEESGFAFYASSGTFHLSDYEYEGTGYTHDTSEKSVIYSEGKLEIILHGTSSIKNTADAELWSANGIRTKGNLIIDGPGTITINAPYAIYGNNLVKFEYGRTVIPSATVAIEAGGNFIVNGGYVELHSTQPIYAGASFISGGSFFATAEQGVFQTAPTISVNTEDEYYLNICTDVEGNIPAAYVPENIKQYKYFKVVPPTLTEINSISVSGVTLPALGGKVGDAGYGGATYGGNYYAFDMYVDMFVDDTWVAAGDTTSIVAGVKYRVVLGIEPEEGYTISADIAGDNVLINGQQATEYKIFEYPDYNSIDIYYEFSYEAPPATPITSISVSGADLPEVGETADDMEFTPDSLTYGGQYKMVSRLLQKFTGTEWVNCDDALEYGVKYRVNLKLAPNEGYAFADTITSDDVTFNGEKGAFDTLIPGAGYASIYYEFYYEVPDYGITIADKDEHGATVGVLITEENYTDVLGDGTVSYDPTTNTLTLNGYKYEGEGIADFGYLAITAKIEDDLVIVMIGENKISVNGDNGSGIIIFGDGNVILTGDGSLTVNASVFGISAQSSGFLAMESGNVTITCTGMPSAAITATNFYMAGGNLKLSSAFLGIALMDNRSYIEIEGGTVEVSVNTAGYGFVYSAGGDMEFEPMAPAVYCFAYDAIASTKTDGSDAVEYDWDNYDTYKYVKISEKETYGILVSDKNESGETVGVYIDKNNYADVLGDGTVSYDPTTNTLTLNGYVYEGEGYWEHGIVGFIEEKLTVNLVGENRIAIYGEYVTGIYFYGDGGVVFTGEGSLAVTSKGRGIDLSCETFEIKGGNITVNAPYAVGAYELKMIGGTLAVNASGEDTCGIDAFNFKMTGGTLTVTASGKNACAIYAVEVAIAGGNLTITSSGEDACAIYTENGLVMNGGSLKINTDYRGISKESYSWLDVCGGTLEIFVGEAGYAFTYWDDDAGEYLLTIPYVEGESNIIASVNADGSGAVTFNEDDLATYKYVKITVKESYGIIVADKDGNGVMIDEKNYANPLGDGTVSYDPATHTLTLNGYKYEGSGFEDDGGYHGILVRPDFMDTLTIVLEGENEITLTTNDAGAMIILDTNAVIKGDGSLKVNSNRYGIYVEDSALEIQGGNTTINALYVVDVSDFTMNGGTLTVTAGGETPAIYARNFTMSSGMLTVTAGGRDVPAIYARNFTMNGGTFTVTAGGNGACAISSQNFTMNGGTLTVTMRGMGVCAIPVYSFTMNGGSIKISTDGFGIAVWSDSTFIICGGTLEISTKGAGCAFMLYDEDADEFLPAVPTLTGDYKMNASVNEDGSGAVEFDEEDFETYKYLSFHIHDYSTTWVTDENEHWNECACGDKANKAAHVDNDGDGKCDECEYPVGGGEITDTETETDDTAVETETETVESSEAESDTEEETSESETQETEIDTEDETDTLEGGGDTETDSETDKETEVGTDPDIGKKSEDGLGAGAIVAIACGSTVVLGTGGFALVWFAIKKKTWADFLALFKKK